MAFDFGKLSTTGAISKITDPVKLFDALPDKARGYGYLRAVQKTVLDHWSKRRTDGDLVIKTNTGGGKTIVGLLMLQCSLHEKVGPALYLAPDPHLAERVCEEAANLGLSYVEDPRSTKFISGRAICITTMQVLLNGRTRFGLEGSGTEPIKVGAIVIDDAHAAIAMAESNTNIRIPETHAAYTALLALFEDDLVTQGLNALMDIKENDRKAVLRVPFWSWHDKQADVLTILRPYRADATFEWCWPIIGGILSQCQAVITSESFEIIPLCPPIQRFPSFTEAARRIYLTATLSDDSMLVTHFDANPGNVALSLVPDSASDLGDRLVLAPQELNPQISDEDVRQPTLR